MNKARKIEPVNNREEKEEIYKIQFKKYDIAIKNQFYLEAISIVYAMCEDKLKSFLYLSGCINQNLEVTKKYRKVLRQIWKLDERKRFGINKISNKRAYILNILNWVKLDDLKLDFNNITNAKVQETFAFELKEKISKEVDINRLTNTINILENWCELRNEIIHGLLNKSSNELDKNLEKCATDGFKLAKELEAIVEQYEKGNNIRKELNIQ